VIFGNTHQKPSRGTKAVRFKPACETPVRISDVQPIVVSCSFYKQISWQYLDYVITASFQLLPHPSLTNHPIVRHYTKCSAWGAPNIRMIYGSIWVKKTAVPTHPTTDHYVATRTVMFRDTARHCTLSVLLN